MHTKCFERGFDIDKESVQLVIKCLDPHGMKCRDARKLTRRTYMNNGPNYIWHMDGYDKLKYYGICINGCIDGFSCNIMWLEAYTTNKGPRVIAGYYIDTVRDDELKIVVRTWNSHKLRSMKNVMSLCGRPELLYNFPELCGADNYQGDVEEAEIDVSEHAIMY
ncbi:unnamed protein product [Mytilus coruscus]|uniref:Integrase core domain-containing protein n=1 Tax=Mytilus coruscus TaxID=42192 RepID=A0A6J8B3L5_MYTCO|nr:unnamed protein product [Mytilus coruscus]